MRSLLITVLVYLPSAFAGDGVDRTNLAGTWEDSGSRWVIENKGDSMHFAYSENGQPAAEFQCEVGGKECEVKDNGKKAKVMLWFNGPKLVQMETRGSEVFKRRFSASTDEMEVETIPITPDGKPQVAKLKRVKTAQ